MRRRPLISRVLLWGGLGAALLAFGGFLLFLARLGPAEGPPPKADAAVVLTGGAGRIEAALELLRARRVERILISGVHPDVRPAELGRTYRIEPQLLDCCIDLGRGAMDTKGNAVEALLWAEERHFTSLVVVTADNHMPRAMYVFDHVMPDAIALSSYPVASHLSLFGLFKEYGKHLVTLLAGQFSAGK